MNHRSLKIAIFCFLWGLIGMFIALQMHPYFWWVGMFSGALGYISWELGGVIRTIPLAWRRATSWRVDKKWWADLGLYLTHLSIYVVSVSGLVTLAFYALFIIIGVKSDTSLLIDLGGTWLGISAVLILVLLAPFFNSSHQSVIDFARQMARECNILTICFKHIPRGTYLLAVYLIDFIPFAIKVIGIRIWNAITIISRFIYHLLRLIHSEERLLIGIYVASGVAIGFIVFHNAIMGGLAAGGLAFAAREIISKRILKVIPLRSGS